MTPSESPRLSREKKTVTGMIGIYCREMHQTQGNLCADCATLHTYSMQRLAVCPFGAGKPACSKCPIHCYQPEMREHIRKVMRYSGPMMIYRHPWLAILHFLDGLRPTPKKP